MALDRFRGDSSLYTFAYRITLNICCNYIAKTKNESKQSLDYDLDLTGYDFSFEAVIDYNIMVEFASTFQRIDREIIYLYLLGEKQDVIAEVLGLSTTNVSSKLNRLKQTIEKHMNRGMDDA